MTDLVPQLTQLLARIAPEADLGAVDAARPLGEQLDIDSMDYLNFLTLVSTTFGVDVPEADYPRLQTLAALADYVAARRISPASAARPAPA